MESLDLIDVYDGSLVRKVDRIQGGRESESGGQTGHQKPLLGVKDFL